MSLDVRDGSVTFDDGTRLWPGMPQGGLPERGEGSIEGTAFVWCTRTEDGALRAIRLYDARLTSLDPVGARGYHDAWLAERLGPGTPRHADTYPYGSVTWRFRWGTAGSYGVPQDFDAYIGIAYH